MDRIHSTVGQREDEHNKWARTTKKIGLHLETLKKGGGDIEGLGTD
jgi:hypothetical protein